MQYTTMFIINNAMYNYDYQMPLKYYALHNYAYHKYCSAQLCLS